MPTGKPAARIEESQWAAAMMRVRDGETLRSVAEELGVGKSTLHSRVQTGRISKTSFGPDPQLTIEGEAKVTSWLKFHEVIGKCVELSSLKNVVRKIATDVGLSITGGRAWLRAFMRRHSQLAVRTGELTSHTRQHAVNEATVATHFATIKPLLEGRPSSKIWNMDEGGFDLGNAGNKRVSSRRIVSSVGP